MAGGRVLMWTQWGGGEMFPPVFPPLSPHYFPVFPLPPPITSPFRPSPPRYSPVSPRFPSNLASQIFLAWNRLTPDVRHLASLELEG